MVLMHSEKKGACRLSKGRPKVCFGLGIICTLSPCIMILTIFAINSFVWADVGLTPVSTEQQPGASAQKGRPLLFFFLLQKPVGKKI